MDSNIKVGSEIRFMREGDAFYGRTGDVARTSNQGPKFQKGLYLMVMWHDRGKPDWVSAEHVTTV